MHRRRPLLCCALLPCSIFVDWRTSVDVIDSCTSSGCSHTSVGDICLRICVFSHQDDKVARHRRVPQVAVADSRTSAGHISYISRTRNVMPVSRTPVDGTTNSGSLGAETLQVTRLLARLVRCGHIETRRWLREPIAGRGNQHIDMHFSAD
jgi:hypothetical protein